MASDSATHGWSIGVQYRNNKAAFDRLTQLPTGASNKLIAYRAVDARRPSSASSIKPTEKA